MHYQQPSGLGKRIASTLLLIIAIAVTARVIYELLLPLLPFMITLLVVSSAYLAVAQRRRR